VPAKTEPSEKDFSHVAQNEDWGNYYLDHGTPLMRAACAGNVAEVQKLLKTSNEAINAKDKYKHTPLMMAAYFGKADVIKELLNAGADVNIQGGGFDETALMLAVYRGNLAIVKELLKAKGINLDLQNMRMKTALDIAKDTGNKDIVTALESAFKKLTFRKMITDQQLRHNNSSFNELKTRLEEQRKTIGIDKKRRVLLIQQALATRQ
jgi:ankyrin repeat protein